MLEALKEKVCKNNIELVKKGIVFHTWGNVSEIDRSSGLVVIKPSGVSYDVMQPSDMVIVDLESGKTVEGKWQPSTDTNTHLEIYKAFSEVGGVVHTHSVNAVAFAQAGMDIPALGTTHADYFYGPIPCTRELAEYEVENDYELNTGKVITECFRERKIDPMSIPGVIVKNHGPFSWGSDSEKAVFHALVMEKVAEMAYKTINLNPLSDMKSYVLDKHYSRKHGANAYYGQKSAL